MGSNDNTSKTTDNPSTQVERGTTEQIFKNLMNKFENFFKFNQNHTNEEVTITISENNVVLTTQFGTEYKADKITLADEEWKLLNERTNEVEKKGRKMFMPKTGNQHETFDLLDEIDKRLNNDSDFPKTTTTGEEVRLKTTERENDPQRKNAKNESSSSSDLQNPVQVG
ncbi:hypothetical protein KQX54_015028, partial [Cotesia glomerata]